MADLGPMYIPPLPLLIRLEDRGVPGKYWSLTHSESLQRVAIRDDEPTPAERGYEVKYTAFHGPYVNLRHRSDKIVRLLVRDGHLGFEVADWPRGTRDQDQAKLWTRRNIDRFILEIMHVALTDHSWAEVPWNPGYRIYTTQVGVEV